MEAGSNITSEKIRLRLEEAGDDYGRLACLIGTLNLWKGGPSFPKDAREAKCFIQRILEADETTMRDRLQDLERTIRLLIPTLANGRKVELETSNLFVRTMEILKSPDVSIFLKCLLDIHISDYNDVLPKRCAALESAEVRILVTGEICAGKSSLMNVLMAGNYLPVDHGKCTRITCELKDSIYRQASIYYEERWLLRFLERASALVKNCKRLTDYAKEQKANLLQYVQTFRSGLSGLDKRCTKITETFKKNGIDKLKGIIKSCMEASTSQRCEWSEKDIHSMMQEENLDLYRQYLDEMIKNRRNDKNVMRVINDYLKELNQLSENLNETAFKLFLFEPIHGDKNTSESYLQKIFSFMKMIFYKFYSHQKHVALRSGIYLTYIPENECSTEKGYNGNLVNYMEKRSREHVKRVTGSWLASVAVDISADIQCHAEQLKTDIQKGIKTLDAFSESVSSQEMTSFESRLFKTARNDCRIFVFLNVMKHEIHGSRLIIERHNAKHVIGQGGFGYVMQGSLNEENRSIPIAAKFIRGPDLQNIFRECLIMRQLMVKAKTAKEFPPIVRYFGSMCSETDDGYELILVMELCDTDLHRQIEMGFLALSDVANAVPFPGAARRTTPRAIFLNSSSYALDIAIQAAKGLCFLHENGIVHRDVKPSNLLMNFRVNQVFVKLTDVGVSKEYNIITKCGQNIGTLLYHSPEIRFNPLTNHSPACDVYSFGLVLWEVWYGRHVFSEIPNSQLEKHITRNTPDFKDYYPPAELKDLIEACWNKTPTVRPHIKQIVQELTKLAA